MKLLDLYNARIVQARTLNEVNEIHIAFANSITPTEVVYLHGNLFAVGKHKPPALRPDSRFTLTQLQQSGRLWIDQLRAAMAEIGKSRTELYRRHDLHDAVVLFSTDRRKPRRNLAVALTGANQRLMMPISTFLQNFDGGSTDILYVRDSSRQGYRNGIPGLADDMAEIGPALLKLIDLSPYQRRVSIGVSAGGLPGLVAALRLGLDATVVCGGNSPERGQFDRPGQPKFGERLKTWRDAAPQVRVTVGYGAQDAAGRECCGRNRPMRARCRSRARRAGWRRGQAQLPLQAFRRCPATSILWRQAGSGKVVHRSRLLLGVGGDASLRLTGTEPKSQAGPGDLPPIVSYYDELVASCATSAQLRGRQLAIETSLVPHEVAGLHEGLADTADYWRAGPSNRSIDPDSFRASTQKWVDRLWHLLQEAGMLTPEPFERVSMSRSLVHYSSGGAAGGKTLVLAFTGHGQCPMIPAAPFLQSLDATQMDMLMLRDLSRRAFQRGLDGVGRATEDLWRQLPALGGFSAYRKVVSLGFSSGTLAALATAMRLGLPKAILFGPIDPVPVTWRDAEGREALRFFSDEGLSYAGEVELVVGAEAADDIAAARTLQSMMHARVVVVDEPDAAVGHNVVGSLLRQGRLRVELERMIGD